MRRREFLLGTGVVGTLGSVGVVSTLVGDIDVRWWATERAAQYPDLHERVEGYLRRGFEGFALSANVSYGGVTSFDTESAYRLVVEGMWPRRLVTGTAEGRHLPVDDVNLLVTDSSMRRAPTGAGVPYVAAVGGARELARAPPADSVGPVVPDSLPMRTVQILLHECGHALGLQHDHGSIRESDDGSGVVVSPMVSGYAWAARPLERRQFNFETNRCGRPYSSVVGKDRHLLLRFDACERRGIYQYRLPALPASPLTGLTAEERLRQRLPCETCALASPEEH
ncbi:hypothetical protein [Halomarina litorea]|uniref:hypothetical protein n=1 Tax=Halomarina litorea TaxID=2961595 RepID=UPI0020C25EDE|nr:hypothetical protein [Halomarina sp. BCD28]